MQQPKHLFRLLVSERVCVSDTVTVWECGGILKTFVQLLSIFVCAIA